LFSNLKVQYCWLRWKVFTGASSVLSFLYLCSQIFMNATQLSL
jgi:hypothetical protein